MTGPLLRKVTIRNYKSIAACKVELQDLVFLVGPNGSGKSNFLDTLRFVSDSLRNSLDHALRERGGIKEVRRRSGGHPDHFALRFDFDLPSKLSGHYSFRIGAKRGERYEVQTEECVVRSSDGTGMEHRFLVRSGKVEQASVSPAPAALADRLYLVNASGLPEFRPVFDALSSMEVYNLNPKLIGELQKPDPGDLLRRDGSNAASVLQHLSPEARSYVDAYLGRIAAGVASVEPASLGSQETIEFRQHVRGQQHPWRFYAASMSDGTLRAFGVLLAAFQPVANGRNGLSPRVIGLEEPEMALHPAASGVLLAALREASRYCQILVTSHSPDLLDNEDIDTNSLLAVENSDGLSRIGAIDQAGRSILRDRLFTPGELLRLNQLAPDEDTLADVSDERQLQLFDVSGR